MEKKFNKGDLVQLNSGGPIMTINRDVMMGQQKFNGNYECVWQDSDGKPHEKVYNQKTLVKPSSGSGGDVYVG